MRADASSYTLLCCAYSVADGILFNATTAECLSVRNLYSIPVTFCGPGSSVGIATDYGLDGPGIESWWGYVGRGTYRRVSMLIALGFCDRTR
jgi:hypothetical protein